MVSHAGRALETATTIDYRILAAEPVSVTLRPSEIWSFGRSPTCSANASLPALSRVALVLEQVGPLLRVAVPQTGRSQVVIDSGATAQHRLGPGLHQTHLEGGAHTLRVELPAVVLRAHLIVSQVGDPPPVPRPRAAERPPVASPASRTPRPDDRMGPPWLTVAGLAVTLARYPALADETQGLTRRPRGALRRAVAAWTGHTSSTWLHERLREALVAADLPPTGAVDHISAVVSHYAPLFSDAETRRMRDGLLALFRPHRG